MDARSPARRGLGLACMLALTAMTVGIVTVAGAVPALAGAPAAHEDEHDGHDDHEADDERDSHGSEHTDHGLAVHDCSGREEPTDADEANAEELIDAVAAAAEQYPDVEAAEAAGYRMTDEAAQSPSPIDHYMRSTGGTAGEELDVEHPDGLVFFADDDGSSELLGFVWRSRAECPPQPAGPLTVWHDHSPSGCPAAHPDCPAATGDGDGAHVPKMFHVWTFDGVEESFAHDLPGALGGDGAGGGPGSRPRLPFDDD